MKSSVWAAILVAAVASSIAAAGQDFHTQAGRRECHVAGSRVIFRGQVGPALAECLGRVQAPTVSELRITSHGGDAWATLQLMKQYAGRIDLVVVETLCASSCANYVIPAARTLIVRANSYVIVHGSIDAAGIARTLNASKSSTLKAYPGLAAKELEAAMAKTIADWKGREAVQAEFEKNRLKCPEWLHPKRWAEVHSVTDAAGLIVMSSMATRCLKSTHILQYWSPVSDQDVPSELRAKKAVRAD